MFSESQHHTELKSTHFQHQDQAAVHSYVVPFDWHTAVNSGGINARNYRRIRAAHVPMWRFERNAVVYVAKRYGLMVVWGVMNYFEVVTGKLKGRVASNY